MHKSVGEYKYFDRCRFCNSLRVIPVINLGLMPLAGGFIKSKKGIGKEKLYPLELNFCKTCFLLQVNTSVNPDTLFKNYFYFSSSINTLVDHFKSVAKNLSEELKIPKGSFVVEIGCNDGAFIKALLANGYKALGVDPAANVVKPLIKKGTPIINDYFTEKLAGAVVKKHGKASAIFSFHSMAHIEDMHDVISGVKKLLSDDGFLAMEVHYLGNLIKEKQYDMIYHEHQYYYSALSLRKLFNRYDMEIFDIKRYDVRAGSIMFLVQHKKGGRKISKSLKDLLREEIKNKLNKPYPYLSFSKKIILERKKLISLLKRLSNNKKKIIGYGASGRGTIIANYCGLKSYLSYVVDDAKAKHGTYLPGTHQEIFPSKKMIKDKTDYAVLFAWPFYKEIRKRNPKFKGKFIVPLPNLKLV